MAEKVTVTKVDDIDGTKAEATVKFALDGNEYEIDLSKKHNGQLRKIFKPYVEAGRKLKRRRGRPVGSKTKPKPAADTLEKNTEGDVEE